jgi:hypothetical protein
MFENDKTKIIRNNNNGTIEFPIELLKNEFTYVK